MGEDKVYIVEYEVGTRYVYKSLNAARRDILKEIAINMVSNYRTDVENGLYSYEDAFNSLAQDIQELSTNDGTVDGFVYIIESEIKG